MSGNTAQEDAAEALRCQAWDLRVQGKTYREIGAQLGVSGKTAHKYCHAVLDRMKAETEDKVEHYRAMQLARLERVIRKLQPLAEDGDLEAIDRLDKLEKRFASLLGLDAPERKEFSGPNGAPIEVDARGALISRLSGLVAGATAGAKESEDSSGSQSG